MPRYNVNAIIQAENQARAVQRRKKVDDDRRVTRGIGLGLAAVGVAIPVIGAVAAGSAAAAGGAAAAVEVAEVEAGGAVATASQAEIAALRSSSGLRVSTATAARTERSTLTALQSPALNAPRTPRPPTDSTSGGAGGFAASLPTAARKPPTIPTQDIAPLPTLEQTAAAPKVVQPPQPQLQPQPIIPVARVQGGQVQVRPRPTDRATLAALRDPALNVPRPTDILRTPSGFTPPELVLTPRQSVVPDAVPFTPVGEPAQSIFAAPQVAPPTLDATSLSDDEVRAAVAPTHTVPKEPVVDHLIPSQFLAERDHIGAQGERVTPSQREHEGVMRSIAEAPEGEHPKAFDAAFHVSATGHIIANPDHIQREYKVPPSLRTHYITDSEAAQASEGYSRFQRSLPGIRERFTQARARIAQEFPRLLSRRKAQTGFEGAQATGVAAGADQLRLQEAASSSIIHPPAPNPVQQRVLQEAEVAERAARIGGRERDLSSAEAAIRDKSDEWVNTHLSRYNVTLAAQFMYSFYTAWLGYVVPKDIPVGAGSVIPEGLTALEPETGERIDVPPTIDGFETLARIARVRARITAEGGKPVINRQQAVARRARLQREQELQEAVAV